MIIRAKKSQEEKLLDHWSKKVKESDFVEVVRRANAGYIVDVAKEDTPGVEEWTHEIAILIARGFPLTRAEYHLALACSYLLGDVDYLTFFKNNWHETDTHQSYGSAKICHSCDKLLPKNGNPKGIGGAIVSGLQD